jgi:hypothetical protein
VSSVLSLESGGQGCWFAQVNWKGADSYSERLVMSIFVCLLASSVRINPRLRVLGVIAAAGAVPCFSVDHMRLMSRTLEKFTCEPVGPDEQNVIG